MHTVSVIIPVRDDEVRLRKCVSCLSQGPDSARPQEIVIIDNGSKHPVSQDWFPASFVKVHHCPNHGSYAARNIGVAAASGDILAFTDSDCLPASDWAIAGSQWLASNRGSILAGRVDVFPQDAAHPSPEEYYDMLFAFPQANYVRKSQFGVTANLFVRRNVFDDVGPFNDKLLSGGDREWGRRASRKGHAILYSDTVVVRHPARRTFGELRKKVYRVARGLAQGGDSLIDRRSLEQMARSTNPPIRNMAYCVLKSRGAPLSTRIRTSIVILRLFFESQKALRAGLKEFPSQDNSANSEHPQ